MNTDETTDEILSETDFSFSCLIVISVLFITGWIILDVVICWHECRSLPAFYSGELIYHQYFTSYGAFINVTGWGFFMLRIIPLSILCTLWLLYGIYFFYTLPKVTEEQYQEWCKKSRVYINFVSYMPYNMERYSLPDRNSFIFVKNEQKKWRLFKLNSHDQKDWDASKWKADENEIKINDVDGLEKIIKELPDVLPENLPPGEKNYVKARILTLFKSKAEG